MPVAEARKTFVLDTNVILHDSSCLTQFKQHDIIIPITVLEELDQFKKGNQSINYHAREFLRSLDALGGEAIFERGVPIGPRARHGPRRSWSASCIPISHFNFSRSKPDDLILNCAYTLAKEKQARAGRAGLEGRQPAPQGQGRRAAERGLHDRPRQGPLGPLHRQARGRDLDSALIDMLYAGGGV